ncbi:hypothetical protein F383_26284 [Gossypium arboreum]|uniref:Uncharacterized protein n=1 Tax=Gossypium arboreum TaxID=29729 RepID=A0A0B0MUD0_GOSAR|nr:hypothetical protein F383_26284 [Gossypium arboreum]
MLIMLLDIKVLVYFVYELSHVIWLILVSYLVVYKCSILVCFGKE